MRVCMCLIEFVTAKFLSIFDISLCSILLFKNGTVLKLCDFGTAKKLEHTLTNAVGTIRYMAPEVIRGVLWEGLFLLLLHVHLVEPPPHSVGGGKGGGGGERQAHVHKISF